METACAICENHDNNSRHHAREMMFGTRDEFDYLECGKCGTLQLINIPDLTAYYPAEYYSLDTRPVFIEERYARRIAAKFIGKHLMERRNLIGGFFIWWRPHLREELPPWVLQFPDPLRFDSRILDFGSGSGKHLRTMRAFGFRDLRGADAFIEKDMELDGLNIFKRSLKEFEPSFDVVMLHHSFEHLPEPKETLHHIHRLLGSGGTALIRIPVVNFAWEKYGINWVQLDPPRHLFLYTEKAFRMIAEEAGFEVAKVVYDSEAFQFHGSEQYLLDIPMNDPRAFTGASETSIFTQQQFDEWRKMAAKLNDEGRGDQACFYLRKT